MESIQIEQITNRIKDRCKEKNCTVTKMLEDCKISRNFMYQFKINSIPSIEVFTKIADYLDCSIDYLMCRTDNPEINK